MNTNKEDPEYQVQKIRTQYVGRESSALDSLKALDKKVKAPANAFAWVFGCVSALVMGAGMSLVMTDISGFIGLSAPMLPGIVTGIIGIIMAAANYPIYSRMLRSRRKKYADEIIALSDSVMNG